MLVLKLGGSLARGGAILPWLAAAAGAGGRVVVVPGGGAYADTVRAEQGRLGHDDDAAHDMALMAMSQLARALAGAVPGLAYADRLDALAAPGPTPVFAAWPALRDAPGLARGWHVTSDSIALWLAARLGADALLVVKSAEPPPGDAAALARAGLLDPAFPGLLAHFAGAVHLVGPNGPPSGFAVLPGRCLREAMVHA